MDYNKAALEMHEAHHGKVGMVSKVEVKTRDDLATAYTPGVAEPCRKIAAEPANVYRYTFKGNMVAVVSNGTAVLGLGNIGPEAALPVMEGKAVLFKQFGGVDAFPVCIDAPDAASVIAACKALAPTFGGIVEEGVLTTVAVIAVRVDNGLGQYLSVFFCFCASRQIPRLLSGNVHVSVDQCQQIVAIRAGGIS